MSGRDDIFHVAIDGPVASGKGTVARELGLRLGIPCLDTGAMYRAFAVYVRDSKIDDNDEAAVVGALGGFELDVRVAEQTFVSVNGVDVTGLIRENEISQIASNVSRYVPVREFMVAKQQQIAGSQSFILEGRDISSVVLPHARFKFYLTASVKTRAARRVAELSEKGEEVSIKQMVAQIKLRDRTDRHKKVGALRRTREAIVVNNTKLSRQQTVDKFLDIIEARLG